MNIVITGGSRGLGEWCVKMFREQGHEVYAPTREFSDLGIGYSAASLIAAGASEFEYVDALINNAAEQGPIGDLHDNHPAEWERCIRVNLIAPAMLCRALLPLMRPGSCIVNISGGGATSPRPNYSAYASAKAGLVRFTETLAEELRPRGIRCNAVAPGKMATAMTGFEGDSPRKAAELVAWLASPESAPITGKLISAVHDDWRAEDFWMLDKDRLTLRRVA